ncbi:DUF937 domain-containing protein [Acidisoma silvae]|uniref:DUF937 domain-containing protein n=2 Tax=Acidisoma silvae TaxID=2802396 RepID=A0A963YUZ7_9PROT|nr:YidB family protein [Acidisoma silvae]MCB8877331.1 DUF937 domain-containing protein [Acidisoma silvae]
MSGLFGQILQSLGMGEAEQNAAPVVHGALSDVLNLNSPDGINNLANSFAASGLGQHVQSWIGSGGNIPITAEQVQGVLSNDQVQALIQRTGLPIAALMPLVSKLLPHAVDQATPGGATPNTDSQNV